MKEYVHYNYKLARLFPREELFSSASQLKRASLSVLLNYIEGFTRLRDKVQLNFYEMSYGSLHEAWAVLEFAIEEGWIRQEDCDVANKLADEIGAMLWSEIESVSKQIRG